MPSQTTKQPKTGGNAVKNISDLMVPFGLILAKDSLEKFLKKQKTSAPKSRKVSLKGGAGCSASAAGAEGYTKPGKNYATVGGNTTAYKNSPSGKKNVAREKKASKNKASK